VLQEVLEVRAAVAGAQRLQLLLRRVHATIAKTTLLLVLLLLREAAVRVVGELHGSTRRVQRHVPWHP